VLLVSGVVRASDLCSVTELVLVNEFSIPLVYVSRGFSFVIKFVSIVRTLNLIIQVIAYIIIKFYVFILNDYHFFVLSSSKVICVPKLMVCVQ
jgi:hypothetical protein